MDLWGALEPTFAPVLAWVCLALPAMKRLLSFHSLVLGKVAVLLVAVVKVGSTRVAFVIVAFTLEVVKIVTWLVEA